MKSQRFNYDRLVKSEDLNHHGTLFAGRSAEWFVEAGFIAAASLLPAQNIVCLKIHGMTFTRPVHPGDIACFESQIVHTGRTSLVAYVELKQRGCEGPALSGFITFVNVDEQGKAHPHGLTLELESAEERQLNAEAKALR